MAGCNLNKKANKNDAYSTYETDFSYIKDNFTSDNFIMSDQLKEEYYSTTLPSNSFFSDKNDLYDNDPLKPKNRRLLYFSKDNNIAISIGYLFSEENLEKRFLTIDSVPVDEINDQLGGKADNLPPYLDQFVMTNKHSFILLKIVYIGDRDITEEGRTKYTDNVKQFFADFTNCLDKQK
jgi:hypothetical protein